MSCRGLRDQRRRHGRSEAETGGREAEMFEVRGRSFPIPGKVFEIGTEEGKGEAEVLRQPLKVRSVGAIKGLKDKDGIRDFRERGDRRLWMSEEGTDEM